MTRATLLLLALAACAPPDTGMAGCWERTPDGRVRYLRDIAPMSSGLCPTPAEAAAMQSVRPVECGTACRLRAWRSLVEFCR